MGGMVLPFIGGGVNLPNIPENLPDPASISVPDAPETSEQAVDTTGEAAPTASSEPNGNQVSANDSGVRSEGQSKQTLASAGPRGKRLNRRLISLSDNSGRETILGS